MRGGVCVRHNLKSIIICDSIHGEKLFVSMNLSNFRALKTFFSSFLHHQTSPTIIVIFHPLFRWERVRESDDKSFYKCFVNSCGWKEKYPSMLFEQDVCLCEEGKLFHFRIFNSHSLRRRWTFSMDFNRTEIPELSVIWADFCRLWWNISSIAAGWQISVNFIRMQSAWNHIQTNEHCDLISNWLLSDVSELSSNIVRIVIHYTPC